MLVRVGVRVRGRPGAAIVAAAGLTLSAGGAAAAPPGAAGAMAGGAAAPGPVVAPDSRLLERPMPAAEAMERLRDRLPEVAARNGLPAPASEQRARRDASLWRRTSTATRRPAWARP